MDRRIPPQDSDERIRKITEALDREYTEAAQYVAAEEVQFWIEEYLIKIADRALAFDEWNRLQEDFRKRKEGNPEYQFEFLRQTHGDDKGIQREMQTIALNLLRQKRAPKAI